MIFSTILSQRPPPERVVWISGHSPKNKRTPVRNHCICDRVRITWLACKQAPGLKTPNSLNAFHLVTLAEIIGSSTDHAKNAGVMWRQDYRMVNRTQK